MRKLLTVTALIGTLVSTPAMAIGDVEQGVLYGVVGYWTFQQLSRIVQPTPAPAAQPSYTTTKPMSQATYKAVEVFIPECNCYRTIMVQIN